MADPLRLVFLLAQLIKGTGANISARSVLIAIAFLTGLLVLFAAPQILSAWQKFRNRKTPRLRCARFMPDGEIATIDQKNVIRLYDSESGSQVGNAKGYRWLKGASEFAFSDDGRYLACLKRNRISVRAWGTGRTIREVVQLDRGVQLTFSSDGHLLALGGQGLVMRVWDWRNGEPIPALEESHEVDDPYPPWHEMNFSAFSPDFRYLATDIKSETVHLWDLEARRLIRKLQVHGEVLSLAMCPRGLSLAAEKILIWEVPSGRLLQAIDAKTDEWPDELKFSPDGRYLATTSTLMSSCDAFGMISLLDVDSGTRLWDCRGYEGLHSVDFSPDGRQLMAIGYPNTANLIVRWQLDNSSVVALPPL